MSVATAARTPAPSVHNFNNPLYSAQVEDRAGCVEEEEPMVEELREITERYRRDYQRTTGAICRSRARFNAAAYVSRLPIEILQSIFEEYVADHWESYYPLGFSQEGERNVTVPPYHWIKSVLHVCRQWRRVGLSTPQLWTVIAHERIYEPWRLDFLLEHATENFPLTLRNDPHIPKVTKGPSEDLRNRAPGGLAFFQQVIQRFAQLETLAHIVTPESGRFLSTLAGNVDAPLMKQFALDLRNSNLKHPPLFPNVNMPCLKSLTLLKGSPELVQRLSCSSLTRLDVSLCHNISVSDLLGVLEGTPSLQHLAIDYVVPDAEEVTIPQRQVQLLSLEDLRLGSLELAAGQLLDQLVFPITALIGLYGEDEFTAPILSRIMPTIRGHTAGSSDLGRTNCTHLGGPHTVRVRYNDTDCYMKTSIWFWGMLTPLVPQSSQEDNRDARSTVVPDCRNDKIGSPRLNLIYPGNLLRILDTADVVSLQLGKGVRRCFDDWRKIFRRPAFLKLETLWLNDDHLLEEILFALIQLAKTASPVIARNANDGCSSIQAPSTCLPLPSLKTLISDSVSVLTTADYDLYGIFDLLRSCAQLGFRFQLLRLTNARGKDIAQVQHELVKLRIADVVEISGPEA